MGAKIAKTNKNIVSTTTSTPKSQAVKSKAMIPSSSKPITSTKSIGGNNTPRKSISKPGQSASTRRIAEKKQKVNANQSNTMETSELDVLTIKKRNNHDYEDKDLINSCLIKHFFMRCLDKDSRSEIIKEMTLCHIDPNTFVFKHGAMGNFVYIGKEGELEL